MFTSIHKQFFALFFLFVKINVTIVFKKIFAIFVIKKQNLIVLVTLNCLEFNKNNLNVKSRSCNNEKEIFLKKFKFLFFFLALSLISFVIFKF